MKQQTQEWKDLRRTKIGASDASGIMGISPWKTPFEVWQEKVLAIETHSWATDRGNYYEKEAREAFEKMTGIAVMPQVIVHQDRKWQMASMDGVSFEGDVFVEIKTPDKHIREMAKSNQIPDFYQAQLQHQFSISPCFMIGFYFTYDPNSKEGTVVEVKKDQSYIDNMLEQEEKFYRNHLLTKEPPPLTERDYVTREDKQWELIAQEWIRISHSLKDLEEKEDELRQILIKLSQGRNCRGSGIQISKSIAKGAVDYKAIPELIGIDLERHRKAPIEKWRIATCG